MTPKEKLNSLLNIKYVTEDEYEYQIELLTSLTNEQIENFERQLPNNFLPKDIRELLKFAQGFEFDGLDTINFDAVNTFGFEEFFPNSIQLTGDGFGNFWILDIDDNGNWGNIFYVCHDPAVVVKHSENLTEFLFHIDEFGKNGNNSTLNEIHEQIVFDIWNDNNSFISIVDAKQSIDEILKTFAENLPDNYVIADLRNKPNKSGFAWGKFGANISNSKRHPTELIWAIEIPEKKKSLLGKLFGK